MTSILSVRAQPKVEQGVHGFRCTVRQSPFEYFAPTWQGGLYARLKGDVEYFAVLSPEEYCACSASGARWLVRQALVQVDVPPHAGVRVVRVLDAPVRLRDVPSLQRLPANLSYAEREARI